ncbi:hypothetical protein BG015_010096 [Linnemannia schmuckeri]|uniref:Uncharacterized protein n=1 Tax=Linnemannia schmuckeri TaxID=64567 RepID=A0A9P5VFJ5_9FUNG|nr:hypothetical protein BG015_010096 [Linnemannia schmuckeri]
MAAVSLHACTLEIFKLTNPQLYERFKTESWVSPSMQFYYGSKLTAEMRPRKAKDSEFGIPWMLEQNLTGWELVDTKVVEQEQGQEQEADGSTKEETKKTTTSWIEAAMRRAIEGTNKRKRECVVLGTVDTADEDEDKQYEVKVVRSEYLIASDGGRFINGDNRVRLMLDDGLLTQEQFEARDPKTVGKEYFESLLQDTLSALKMKVLSYNWITTEHKSTGCIQPNMEDRLGTQRHSSPLAPGHYNDEQIPIADEIVKYSATTLDNGPASIGQRASDDILTPFTAPVDIPEPRLESLTELEGNSTDQRQETTTGIRLYDLLGFPGVFYILVFAADCLATARELDASLVNDVEHYQRVWSSRWPGLGVVLDSNSSSIPESMRTSSKKMKSTPQLWSM